MSVVEVFKDLIVYYSEIDVPTQLKSDGVITKKMRDLAIEIIRKKTLVPISQNRFAYINSKNKQNIIDTLNLKCDCVWYLDKKACCHLTAACLQDNIVLPGLKSLARSLRTMRRTKKSTRETTLNESFVIGSPLNSPIIAQLNSQVVEPEVQKRGRGRPKKMSSALANEDEAHTSTRKQKAKKTNIKKNRNSEF